MEYTERLIWGCISLVFALFAVIGNAVALITIASTRSLHSPPIVLIGFLAIVDCLIGLLHLLPVSIAWFSDAWPGGPSGNLSDKSYNSLNSTIYEAKPVSWCGISSLFFDVFSSLSLATTVVICLERCFALHLPLKYPRYVSVPSIGYACFVGWIVAMLFNLPIFLLYKGARYVEPLGQCVPEFADLKSMLIFLRVRLIFRLSCLVLITTICILTIRVVLKHYRISRQCLDLPKKSSTLKMIHATTTQVSIVLLSIITWLPHFTYLYLRIFLPQVAEAARNEPVARKMRVVVWYFFYLSSVINPIIYSFRLRTVRLAVKRKFSRAVLSLDTMVIERIKSKIDGSVVISNSVNATSFRKKSSSGVEDLEI